MFDLFKNYIENRLQLIKLELVGTVANVMASLVSSFLILVVCLFILLMLSLSLAFYLTEVFDSRVLGFLSVGGLYILFFILYLSFFKKSIDTLVKDQIVKTALSSENELKDDDVEYYED